MTEHDLKCWRPYYNAVVRGEKNFQVRRDDRGFQRGDIIILREFDRLSGMYMGPWCKRQIAYVLTGGQFGIEPGYVVLGLTEMPSAAAGPLSP